LTDEPTLEPLCPTSACTARWNAVSIALAEAEAVLELDRNTNGIKG
jgi:hypothetical protein